MSSTIPDLAALHALGAAQQPTYPDQAAVDGRRRAAAHGCRRWSSRASATTSRPRSPRSSRGEAFLLQGGDCAETFDGVTADNVRNKLRVLLQMAVVLTYAALGAGREGRPDRRPVRQAALLRPGDPRRRDAAGLPRRRGQRLRLHARGRGSPTRSGCVDVYNSSAATLNLVRAFVTGGYADLRQVHTWNTDFVRESSSAGQRYEAMAAEIEQGADLHAARSAPTPTSSTGSTSTPATRRCCSSTSTR